MRLPNAVLLCRPDYFDVIDVKNPFMKENMGRVDQQKALQQWENLRASFESVGLTVETIPAIPGLEDMVFCANQTFVGLTPQGKNLCILSQMKHASRRKEIPAFAAWFKEKGYQVSALGSPSLLFEGGGDALWHPERRLIWGGIGQRTQPEAYPLLSRHFEAPVITLEMKLEHTYHLDTCFCAVDKDTALVYPDAFTDEGKNLIHHFFRRVITVDRREAIELMACNAAAFSNKYVFIQKGAIKVNEALRKEGFEVIEVETSEFLKSGGSVFCMKMSLF